MEENITANKRNFVNYILLTALTIITAISLYTNTTTPRLWIDEGKTVELARNFLDHQILDIQTAPGQFSGITPSLQSTGYPVTIPLAVFFGLFGLGPDQARIFMLIWLLTTLYATFFVANKIFNNKTEAILSFLLIASFASFYDNGKTTVGEIPGFLFLLTGIYYWLKKEDHYKTGLWWGLAVVTKPSVFMLIIPAITLALFEQNIGYIKKLSKIAVAMIPAAVVWFIVVIRESPMKVLAEIGNFYQNPYSSPIYENVLRNLKNLPFQTTIIYFTGLFVAILIARYLIRNEENNIKKFYNFVIIYTPFALIYYLRSPGWLRYIVIAEILILFILPNALKIILENIKNPPQTKVSRALVFAVTTLVVLQTVQLFTISKIFSSIEKPAMISYLNTNYPHSSIATIEVIEVSAFLKTDKRYNMLNMTGMTTIGTDPLLLEVLPEIVVARKDVIEQENAENIITNKYSLIKTFGLYEVYGIKSR